MLNSTHGWPELGKFWGRGWHGSSHTIPITEYIRSSRSLKLSDVIATADIFLFLYIKKSWPHPHDMWDLSSPTRDRTLTPCIGRQSLNHWTAGELQHQLMFHNMLLFGPPDNTLCLIGLSPFSRWENGCSPGLPPRASETKTLPCCFSSWLEFSPSSCTCDCISFVYSGGENSAVSPFSQWSPLRPRVFWKEKELKKPPGGHSREKRSWKRCLLWLWFFKK